MIMDHYKLDDAAKNRLRLRSLTEQIRNYNHLRYSKIRTQHPEFQDLSEHDIEAYIEAFDEHIGQGFQPSSPVMIIGGCFILFCDWLFFNAGSSGTIKLDKDNNVALTTMNTILSAVGAATATSIRNMLKFDSNIK